MAERGHCQRSCICYRAWKNGAERCVIIMHIPHSICRDCLWPCPLVPKALLPVPAAQSIAKSGARLQHSRSSQTICSILQSSKRPYDSAKLRAPGGSSAITLSGLQVAGSHVRKAAAVRRRRPWRIMFASRLRPERVREDLCCYHAEHLNSTSKLGPAMFYVLYHGALGLELQP